MYCAYKLNYWWQYATLTYSFPSLEPVHYSMSGSNCCFLTCTQVSQEVGRMVWYFYLFRDFPQVCVIHTVKGSSTVDEADIDVFLELSCFFYDSADVGNLISGTSAFSKPSLYIWKFSVHILLKCSLKDFEHYLAIMQTTIHSSSGTLADLITWIYSSSPLHNHNGFDLGLPKWPSGFPYFLQVKHEVFSKVFMIWVTVSSRSVHV